MTSRTTETDAGPIGWRLTRSARARVLRVHVSAGDVNVVVPRRCPAREAERLVRDRAGWITLTRERARRRLDEAVRAAGLGPGLVLLRGAPTPVGRLPEWPADRWLRREARSDLSAAVDRHRHLVARPPGRLRVGDQRSRWGSCSGRGTLSFTWRLVMAPPAVLDYLVIHELTHLDVPDHSPEFWRRVRSACPAVGAAEAWLRANQAVLMRPLSACGPASKEAAAGAAASSGQDRLAVSPS